MRHFESRYSLRIALLPALAYGIIACSSDAGHAPPVGAPNVPVVIVEGGGAGGSINSGQGAANNAGNPGDPGVAGALNAIGGAGGTLFTDPSTGGAAFGSPSAAGSPTTPPFSASGSSSTFGGSTF